MNKNNVTQLQGVINSKENEFLFGLYLLKVSYKSLLEILETFCGGFFNIPDPNLNFCYLECLKQIRIILNSQEKIYREIGDPPLLFESLVGNIEEADQKWELEYRQTSKEYYGKVENLFIQNESKSYELPKFIQNFFDFTKKAVMYHRNYEKIYRLVFGIDKAEEKIIQFGNITLNVKKSFLQYKKNPPVEISPTSREIVLLTYLINNTNSIVEYLDIAKLLNPAENYDYLSNTDVARQVQFVRRDLVKILKRAGLTRSELRKLITAKTCLGYILRNI